MTKYYTDERNAQILIALLKEHGIKKVIASPGTTNMAFVASIQNDSYFEVYSSVDERSAAYIACGLAAESQEPVVISCTGATASRNYLPGLTEAYYRKLPVLAVTSSQAISKVGHHVAQVIDRSSMPNDVAKHSVALPIVKDDDDFWECEIKVNEAILELTRHGGGPVHINLPTTYSTSFAVNELPKVRKIDRITLADKYPELPKGKIMVFIGAHKTWTNDEIETLDRFCAINDAVVFCDHTSGYRGKYRVLFALAAFQQMSDLSDIKPELVVHIGEITGDYYTKRAFGEDVWRVSDDGEIRDTFNKLRYVFEMSEQSFFQHYSVGNSMVNNSYLKHCKNKLHSIQKKLPELPFSNIWIASQIAHVVPPNSTVHFGILNSLRSWNFFEVPDSVSTASNVGGFGIDGDVSSLVGASLANREKLYFGIVGDLAFFYDMNVLGNRHIANNLRILLVNNGKGTEFRQFNHVAAHFGQNADEYIAAAGHFGEKSSQLVKHYAKNLGFEYIFAGNKDEFNSVSKRFLTKELTDRPMLLEVFTNSEDESKALELTMNIVEELGMKTKRFAKQVLGERGFNVLKKAVESGKK